MRLAPDGLAEVDLLLLGQSAGSRTGGRANRRAGARTHAGHCAKHGACARAYARAAHHPVSGSSTAADHTSQHHTREQMLEAHDRRQCLRLERLVVG